MKVFAVLLLALCAVSLVFAYNTQRSSSGNSNDYASDNDQQWQGQEQRTQPQQTPWESTNWESKNSEEPSTSAFVDNLPFRLKITQRLEHSEALTDQTETKEKLVKFFEDKLRTCSTPNAGKHKVDRQCAGRLTGQTMQMIAMFEKGGQQNMPIFSDW